MVNNNLFFMNRRTINCTSQYCEACTSACVYDRTPFPGRPANAMFFTGIDETSMTSMSSEKVSKQEIDAPETISLLKNDSSKAAYECDEPEEEMLSDYNLSDDEFTPSKRKRRKEAPVRKVDGYQYIVQMIYIF